MSGSVCLHSRPGPATVLTEEEEVALASYLVQMADMGFGVSKDVIMAMAYYIVEKSHT